MSDKSKNILVEPNYHTISEGDWRSFCRIRDLMEEIEKLKVDSIGKDSEDYARIKEKEHQLIRFCKQHKEKFGEDLLSGFQIDFAEIPKEQRSKAQVRKNRVREIAKKLWDENPELTIAAIAKLPEITEASEHRSEKTIRKYLKDLNPNPKPGRRKGT